MSSDNPVTIKFEIAVPSQDDPSRVARQALEKMRRAHGALLANYSRVNGELFDALSDVSDLTKKLEDAVAERDMIRRTTNELHRRIQRTEGDIKIASAKGLHDGCRRELQRVKEGRNTDMAMELAKAENERDGWRMAHGKVQEVILRMETELDRWKNAHAACQTAYKVAMAERDNSRQDAELQERSLETRRQDILKHIEEELTHIGSLNDLQQYISTLSKRRTA